MTESYLRLYEYNPLLRLALIRASLSPTQIGIMAFIAYWGLTLILCLLEGTAIPQQWSQILIQIFGLSLSIRHIASPMLTDIPHLIAGLMSGVTIGIVAHMILQVERIFEYVKSAAIFHATPHEYDLFAQRVNEAFTGWSPHIIALAVGLFVFRGFFLLTESSIAREWWGYSAYGFAGCYLALVLGVWVYLAMWGVVCALRAMPLYYKFLKEHMCVIRPVWPDGSNGLRPWGNLILELVTACLGLGLVMFSVYEFGYFGIEKSAYFWVVVAIYLGALPVILIAPLGPLVQNLRFSKAKALEEVAREIQNRYATLQQKVQTRRIDSEYSCLLEEIEQLRRHYTIIEGASVWPFDVRLLRSWIFSYILQIGLALFGLLR